MHIRFLVEGTSDEKLLEVFLPKIIGNNGEIHSWRAHPHRGKGHIPENKLTLKPNNPTLLGQLPFILKGFGKSGGIDAVVILIDTDTEDCRLFLHKMTAFVDKIAPRPKTLIRLAIEESEAWYLGDRAALQIAFPEANLNKIKHYQQDSACGTWELVADLCHPGGAQDVIRQGIGLSGQLKHEWAEKIGPHLDPSRNLSPSFQKFCSGLKRLVAEAEAV